MEISQQKDNMAKLGRNEFTNRQLTSEVKKEFVFVLLPMGIKHPRARMHNSLKSTWTFIKKLRNVDLYINSKLSAKAIMHKMSKA